ncbi:aminotransferase class III-fold pyridoxal phosphate-dependent enzyme [Kriegella sp. EG-1]|nr:aminotransferase class III-fold pyridoxal phosphate-dependent enzyme [Flavobacteriaceae bacterium EG-1]
MKEDFLTYQTQTSPHPLAIEISRALGSYIYDTSNKSYLDFIAGVSACTLGHCHPKIINAVQKQTKQYMHVMVYGEFVLEPAVLLCKLLAEVLPSNLNTTYLVNSGTEAIEGAIKLARRFTGKSELISAKNGYHGNTMGSLSLLGYEERKSPFRPLIPNVKFIEFNNEADLLKITNKTAAVVLETIQGGAGFILPSKDYLTKVRARCNETGSILILDEIQPGFGRTGKLFAFEHYNCIPDILVMGKGMASGLPVGAFTASQEMMATLQEKPKLGHITTFGGNPVIAAASVATLRELLQSKLMQETLLKEALFRKLLQHQKIKEIRGKGLMLAIILENVEITNKLILKCKEEGLLLFWLLFEPCAVRITPPLTINIKEIEQGCNIILSMLDKI